MTWKMILSRRFVRRAVMYLSLASMLAACGGDRREYSYKTLADANKAGEITRGWLPDDLIPSSSHDIRLVEELSPSHEWCAFDFLTVDSENLRKNLKSVDELPRAVRRVPGPHVSWWPETLQGSIKPGQIRNAGFELYVVERPANDVEMGIYLFAVNWRQGHGFFYWTYEPQNSKS